ncbi:MAG: flagellar motor protein MotB [Bacillota bacterium]
MHPLKKKPAAGGNEWLITYSDLVTLLLVFFVLLYAFSKVDLEKFQGFVESFQGQGVLMEGSGVLEESLVGGQEDKAPMEAFSQGNVEGMYQVTIQFLRKEGLLDLVEVSYQEVGVALNIKEAILFDSGNAVLKPGARELLNRLAGFLDEIPNEIVVEGHTDNRPISTLRYPSNWELSVDRAVKVVRYLTEEEGLEPGKFVALGYGEHRPEVPNTTAENRAKNRRVMIIIKANEVPSEVSGE